jgi:hypothetical protein
MTITDREENVVGTYWVLRRRADGTKGFTFAKEDEKVGRRERPWERLLVSGQNILKKDTFPFPRKS